jgi:hypothetical protein
VRINPLIEQQLAHRLKQYRFVTARGKSLTITVMRINQRSNSRQSAWTKSQMRIPSFPLDSIPSE